VEYGSALVLYSVYLLWLHLRNNYHVIHVHNMPDFLILTALIPRLLGAKVILDVHDPMPEFFMSKFQSNESSGAVRLMQAQERLSARVAHAVIAANPNFKDSLLRRGTPAKKVTVVMNVPDSSIFDRSRHPRRKCTTEGPLTLLYPGTLAPRYGLDVAIRALGLLRHRIPSLRLVLVGDRSEYVDDLRRLAEELGVYDRVQIIPAVSIEDVPRLMSEAFAGIYPALPDPHMNIATPSKVLEYAAMGLPIIASRIRVLRDMFSESEILFFSPGEPQEMADCISRLVDNPELAGRLVENLDRGFGRSYSWFWERQKYYDLLGCITGDGRCQPRPAN
jgi:glycosyltransferase involved in cell wall biosynthesis